MSMKFCLNLISIVEKPPKILFYCVFKSIKILRSFLTILGSSWSRDKKSWEELSRKINKLWNSEECLSCHCWWSALEQYKYKFRKRSKFFFKSWKQFQRHHQNFHSESKTLRSLTKWQFHSTQWVRVKRIFKNTFKKFIKKRTVNNPITLRLLTSRLVATNCTQR